MSLNVRSSIEVNTSNAEASINNLRRTFERFNNQTAASARGLDNLAHSLQAGAIAFNGIKNTFNAFSGLAGTFTQTADAINTMNARLQQSTKSTAHFTALRAGIDKIAKSTYSNSESISNLFINVNQSLSEMGLSQKNALEMSETLSKALRVGGASAVDAERAITQFSQALSTGKLQGQDFKAMIGAAPILLKNMADALGVTTGELRTMASEGQLTNEKLVEAFSNMKDSVDNAFSKMPVSVADATQLMSNSINGLI